MDTEAAQAFFSVLTVAADVAVVGLLACWLLARRGVASAGSVVAAAGGVAVPLAGVVALTCTLGSLYFSEIGELTPCALCWYQRIAMYPLVVILGVGVVLRDRAVRRYAVPLAAIGFVIATYHYLIEWFPEADSGVCSATIPCTFVYFRELGFISLPFMAMSGFALIITLLILPTPEET